MEFFEKVAKLFTEFNNPVLYVMEFLLLAILFFLTLRVLYKNKAKLLIVFFVVYTLAISVICYFSETATPGMALLMMGLFIIFVVCLFATEIKREVWATSIKGGEAKHGENGYSTESANHCIDEIIKALQSMSKNNVGAIIILANSNMPTAILESGVSIDSEISSALIESVFFPKTPLHDGAMVINGTKIQSAGCFLPLSQELNLPKDLGTRHRAGIGITETINVTSIIVSEETGVISIANGGKLMRYADNKMLKETLDKFYWQDKLIG